MGKKKEENLGTITKIRAIKIFEALGFKTADKWDVTRLQKKLGNLNMLVEGTGLDEKNQKKVNEILRAQKNGLKVTVIDVENAERNRQQEREIRDALERGRERAAEKKARAAKNEEKDAVKNVAESVVAKKQATRIAGKKKDGSPGVIMSVLEFVKNQGPISKKEILDLLKKRFPNRNPESMGRTISQIPSYLSRKKSISNIKTDDKGLYIFKK